MKKFTFKKTLCLAAALSMLAATACGSVEESRTDSSETVSSSQPVQENTASPLAAEGTVFEKTEGSIDGDFLSGAADFSVGLFRNTAKQDIADGKNALISPESVLFALGMTANGAQGETLEQMNSVLSGTDTDSLNANLGRLYTKAEDSEYTDFSIANSLWVKNDGSITLKQDYADKVKSVFNGDIYCEPFDQSTVNNINGWVNENTNQMIPSIIDDLSPDSVACLVNAIAFEAEWEDQYEDGQVNEDGEFTNANGEKESCAMLGSSENVYIHDDNSQGFLKYYKGGDYAFMAILPDEGTSVSGYMETMTGESLMNPYKNRQHAEVIAEIPEFTYDYSASLKDSLISMGMELPFNPNADFSAMGSTETGMLYIDQVLHKTHIELDRNGTKAAAATAVIMAEGTAIIEESYEVRLDRPFIYAIVETESGFPVFIGVVNTVAE